MLEVMHSSRDMFNRPRDTTPDIGAYEYIAPRKFVIRDDGSNVALGTTHATAWDNFVNLDDRILNPGDDILLKKDDSWADQLNLRAVGSATGSVEVRACETSDDAGCTGTAKPAIDGSSVHGLYSDGSSYVDISDIDIKNSNYNGIRNGYGRNIDLDNVDIYKNAFSGGTGAWNSGIYWESIHNYDMNDVETTWNNGIGLWLNYNSGTCTLHDSTISYNGQIGLYKYGIGVLADINLDMADLEVHHNGMVGIGVYNEEDRPGNPVTIINANVSHNGNGWAVQGVKTIDGNMVAGHTDFVNGDFVKQQASGAVGWVHACKDSDFDSSLLSVVEQSGTFNNSDKIDICDPNNASCTGVSTSQQWENVTTVTNYGSGALWSGGGIDLINADGANVSFCDISYSYRNQWLVPVGDAYGIDIDRETDGAKVWGIISHDNDGAGFHFNDSGKNTVNAVYNCLAFNNTINSNVAGGIYFGFGESQESACQAIVKNTISVDDNTTYSLVARENTTPANITLDNNVYWMGSGMETIHWRNGGTATSGSSSTALEDTGHTYDFKSWMQGMTIVNTTDTCTTTISSIDGVDDLTTAACDWSNTDVYYIDLKFKDSHASDADFADYKGHFSLDSNSLAEDPKVIGLGGAEEDRYKLYVGSPCFEAGTPLATEMGCTASVDCYDYFGNVIPFDEDGVGGAQWDIGVWEKQSVLGIIPRLNNMMIRRRMDNEKLF
jgi:hypothetical protein